MAMNYNMTRRAWVKATGAAALAAPAAALTGCSSAEKGSAGGTGGATAKHASNPLTVYLWDTDLIGPLTSYLHEQLPGADIQFIAGNNDLDLYSYLLEHGNLPDILTVRRFAGTEARDLQPHLLDLSAYDVVSEFSSYSLQYYKSADGQINWLPVCGIPQTIIANKTLFDQCGLDLPQSYDEYAQACQVFAEKGIKPYALDLAQDWSSHEMVQAGGIGELTSLVGITWRAQAESAEGDIAFDDTLWASIFSHTRKLLQDSRFTQDDLSLDTAAAMKLFTQGQAAMFHGSPVHLKQCRALMDAELVRLPYFSQTSGEGYIYMTPSLHVALNKDLENDADRLSLAMDVVEHMISAKGQELIANGSSVISFNPAVASLTEGMGGLENELQDNRLYIRYSAQKSFAASAKAVRGLLTGQMDETQALGAFRATINGADEQAASVITFEKDLALSLNDKCGRDAASAILATVAKQNGAELALAPYYWFASPIYQGECSANRVSLMIANKSAATSLYLATLSGARIKELVEKDLSGAGGVFCPSSVYELPVASGMKLVVERDNAGFTLNNILVDGSTIDAEKFYSVLLTDSAVTCLGPDAGLEPLGDSTLATAWAQAIKDGCQLAEPEDYIEVRD